MTRISIHGLKERLNDESGFMGTTHALSAVAVALALFAFKPEWYKTLFHTTSLSILALLCLVIAGGALMSDLDNTQSSAKSSLGFIGKGLSIVMRTTAPIIQGLIHTKYDKDTDEAHRGFYHTAAAAILFGGLMTFLCGPTIHFAIGPVAITGKIIAIILAFVASHISLSVLAGPIIRQLKSGAGQVMSAIIPTLFSIGVVWILLMFLPDNTQYTIMGIGFGLGWLIHEIGDCFTTAGDPILAPLRIKGKCWYKIRFLPIKAGGLIEYYVFTPAFIIIIAISLLTIFSVI